jgi:hypothetical protein
MRRPSGRRFHLKAAKMEHELDFADAFNRLELWVSLYHAEVLTSIDVKARELMAFAANALGYQCPDVLPQLRLDTEMEAVGQFIRDIKVIALKRWDGSIADQGVLVHEFAHYLQQFNKAPMCEIEAITAQCMWVLNAGGDRRDMPTAKTIKKLTGDDDFASLKWLAAGK